MENIDYILLIHKLYNMTMLQSVEWFLCGFSIRLLRWKQCKHNTYACVWGGEMNAYAQHFLFARGPPCNILLLRQLRANLIFPFVYFLLLLLPRIFEAASRTNTASEEPRRFSILILRGPSPSRIINPRFYIPFAPVAFLQSIYKVAYKEEDQYISQ